MILEVEVESNDSTIEGAKLIASVRILEVALKK